METDKLKADAIKGLKAADALAEVGEVLSELEAKYITAWKETAVSQSDERHAFWQAVQVVGLVRTHLQRRIDNGKIAQAEIAALNKAANN